MIPSICLVRYILWNVLILTIFPGHIIILSSKSNIAVETLEIFFYFCGTVELMATIFNSSKRQNILLIQLSIICKIIFKVFYPYRGLVSSVELNVYSHVMISKFMMRFKHIMTWIRIENLNSRAKCLNFTELEIFINFLLESIKKILKLRLCCEDGYVKVCVVGNHSPISISA